MRPITPYPLCYLLILFLVRLQRVERLLDQLAPHFQFSLRRRLGVADGVDVAVAPS